MIKRVVLSSSEAEIMSLNSVTRHSIYFRNLATEIGFEVENSIVIHEDCRPAISATSHFYSSPAHRHIDVQAFFVAECLESGDIEIHNIRTEDQIADFFTKSLPYPAFRKHRERLLKGLVTHWRK